jgi:hypothetical protein
MKKHIKIEIEVDDWEYYCSEKCDFHIGPYCELFSKRLERKETSDSIRDERCHECRRAEEGE